MGWAQPTSVAGSGAAASFIAYGSIGGFERFTTVLAIDASPRVFWPLFASSSAWTDRGPNSIHPVLRPYQLCSSAPATPFGRLADSADISQQDTMADEAVDIFKVFDKDFDGKLQALEMHQALGAAGLCAAIEDVQLALKEAGESGGDLQCFQKLLQQFQSTKPTNIWGGDVPAWRFWRPPVLHAHAFEEFRWTALQVIDPASSGRVDTSALRYLLMNFNEKLSDAEATEFMELLKLPKEGLVEIADICSRLEKSLQ
ncbi:uncharacterized protein LOC34622117 [Cyclospora cayetanensis]|uniref:Calmodulin n=1 Tax=Cyclospora cayetanensis TaxID=88456 RepID=A0A6P6S356_9EIME|nr:uncharacterized protein LOC34622117 [Cyclospora cayetanensis]